ncbi:alcohol dehydrogenase catalytic domain-containing protein [Pseudomonas gingeri]|nr:alcohol dehydrogenase catalytic domain-containing protein [Pseudomonas gingeri]NWD70373.1 alcohol dehydrogenase catalytic domain-containing protein [Pseudomonas gingeri]
MQRVVFRSHGSPSVLEHESLTLNPLKPGQVRVRNQAIGVNFIDTYFRSGLYQPPGLPSGLGTEGAGTVVECAVDVNYLQVGDRVGLLKGLTTLCLFKQASQPKSGDTVSFHAAAGGVGLLESRNATGSIVLVP